MYRAHEVVEIRVHGVSGTPPEKVLGEPLGDQVAGDDSARFFRARRPAVASRQRLRRVEAFHWGRFTSGSPSRALWLVLVPFALLNVSRYMLLLAPRTPMSRAGRFADGVLRVLGVLLTLMLITSVAYVPLEIVVHQCTGNATCLQDNGWLSFVDTMPFGLSLILGAVPLAALIALLWWFGRMTFLHEPPGDHHSWKHDTGDFGDHAFWHMSPKAPVLRAAHVAAACALAGTLVAGVLRSDAEADPLKFWTSCGLTALGILLLVMALRVVVKSPEAEKRDDAQCNDPRQVPADVAKLKWISLIYLVVVVGVVAGLLWHTELRTGPLVGFEATTNFLAVFAAAALVALAFACRALKRGSAGAKFMAYPRTFRPMWRGYATLFIASFATMLATAFSGGLAFRVADLLGQPEITVAPTGVEPCGCDEVQAQIQLSTSYWTGALLWGAITVLILLMLLTLLVIGRRLLGWHKDKLATVVELDYELADDGDEPKPRGIGKVATNWRLALTKYHYHRVLGAISALGGALVVASGVIAVLRLLPWWRDSAPTWLVGWFTDLRLVVDLGGWVVSGVIAALLFLGLRSWRGQGMRTGVGVVWDLIAFWPRLAHPICPPPYGGRAALALASRANYLVNDKGVKVIILSGHSQGSVVCTAAVRMLHAESSAGDGPHPFISMEEAKKTVSGLRLVTYGSQLQWAFARMFPTYMGYDEMRVMYTDELETRWRNVFRWTDPLGGPVLVWPEKDKDPHPSVTRWKVMAEDAVVPLGFSGPELIDRQVGPDTRLRDPESMGGDEAARTRAELRGHSGYYSDPEFNKVVADLVGPA